VNVPKLWPLIPACALLASRTAVAEPGSQGAPLDLFEVLAPQATGVAILVGGAVLAAVAAGLGIGWVWRTVTKRKTSWWWFVGLGLLLGGVMLAGCVLVVLLAFR
jgi:hypothetical protein